MACLEIAARAAYRTPHCRDKSLSLHPLAGECGLAEPVWFPGSFGVSNLATGWGTLHRTWPVRFALARPECAFRQPAAVAGRTMATRTGHPVAHGPTSRWSAGLAVCKILFSPPAHTLACHPASDAHKRSLWLFGRVCEIADVFSLHQAAAGAFSHYCVQVQAAGAPADRMSRPVLEDRNGVL